jgi:hypothetical protein
MDYTTGFFFVGRALPMKRYTLILSDHEFNPSSRRKYQELPTGSVSDRLLPLLIKKFRNDGITSETTVHQEVIPEKKKKYLPVLETSFRSPRCVFSVVNLLGLLTAKDTRKFIYTIY